MEQGFSAAITMTWCGSFLNIGSARERFFSLHRLIFNKKEMFTGAATGVLKYPRAGDGSFCWDCNFLPIFQSLFVLEHQRVYQLPRNLERFVCLCVYVPLSSGDTHFRPPSLL